MNIRKVLALGIVTTLASCVPGSPIYLGDPVATVEGTVNSLEDGTPLGGTEVCIQGSDTVCVRSDNNGRYKAYYRYDERVDIQFRVPGMRPAVLESVAIAPPESYDFFDCRVSTRLTLSTGRGTCRSRLPALIEGTFAVRGTAVEHIFVCAIGTDLVCDESDDNGRFRMFYRTEEPIDLWFAPGLARASVITGVNVSGNTTYTVDCGTGADATPPGWGSCSPHQPAIIRGHVRSVADSSVLAGIRVCIEGGTVSSCAQSGADGAYALYHHFAETVNIVFSPNPGRPAIVDGIEVVPAEAFVVDCALSTRYSSDQEPVRCGWVPPED